MNSVDKEAEEVDPAVQAATAIFSQYGDFIRTVIRFQAENKLDSDDLYQEFYLSLIHKPLPADVRDFKSYLYRAVLNFVISAIRRQKNYSCNLKKYAKEAEISINSRPTKDAFVDDEHQDATVTRLAGHLQQRPAQAFVLKYRDDCSIHEIATKMGVGRRTVSRYLSESIKRLHGRLAPE